MPAVALLLSESALALSLDTSGALVPGRQVTLIAQTQPNEVVSFTYGFAEGNGPCPPALLGRCLDILNPVLIGQDRADGRGRAELTLTVPANAPLRTVYLQAAEAGATPDVSEVEALAVRTDQPVFVAVGTFTMGCVAGRDDVAGGCYPDESPSRQVTLTVDLYVTEAEMTQAEWTAYGFVNSAIGGTGGDRPMNTVNWWEALHAANARSAADGLPACYDITGCDAAAVGNNRQCTGVTVLSGTGHPKDCAGWRLPTEAEWEYLARGGQSFAYAGGSALGPVAWTAANSGNETGSVCTRARNGFGVCDLTGNVGEWTWDWHDLYPGSDEVDPTGASTGIWKVNRGGYYSASARDARIATRWVNPPGAQNVGVRLVRSAP